MTAPSVVELALGRHVLRLDAVERLDDAVALEVHVRVGEFTARSACDVAVEALRAWRDDLQRLYESLSGRAVLEQHGLRVGVEGDGKGRVGVEGEVDRELGWGDGSRAVLRFTLPPLDQSHLPPVVAALDAALALEPIPEDDR